MNEAPRKRPQFWQRKYLINQGFQLKYISYVVGISTIISGLLCYFIYRGTLENTELMEIKEMQLGSLIAQEDSKIMWALLAFIILQGLCILIFALMLTHRIAGPLFRVELFLKALSEGRLLGVRSFRKGDEFQSLVDLMRAVNGRLQDQKNQEIGHIDNIDTALGSSAPADVRETLFALRKQKAEQWNER